MKLTDAEIDTLQANLKTAQWNLFACQQERDSLRLTSEEKQAVAIGIECLKHRDAYYLGDMDELIAALSNLLERHNGVSVAEVD